MRNAVFILGAALALACSSAIAEETGTAGAPADAAPAAAPVIPHVDALRVVIADAPYFRGVTLEDVTAYSLAVTPNAWIKVAVAKARDDEIREDVQDTGLVDPAQALAADLSSYVAMKTGATSIDGMPRADGKNDSDKNASTASQKRFAILNVRTTKWGFRIVSSASSTYQINYSAQVELIYMDAPARRSCFYSSGAKNAPTYEQMLANDGAILKAAFARAESDCLKSIESRLFVAVTTSVDDALELLQDDDPRSLRHAAQDLLAQPSISVQSLDIVANAIAANRSVKGDETGDSLAWLCKVLGKSGNGRYRPFLEQTASSAADSTLRRYAEAAAKALPAPGSDVYHVPELQSAGVVNVNPVALESDAQLAEARKQASIAKSIKLLRSSDPDDMKQGAQRLQHRNELTVDQMDALAEVINANAATTDPKVVGVVALLCQTVGKNDTDGRYKPFLKSIGDTTSNDSIRDAAHLAVDSMPDPDMNVYSPPPAASKLK